MRETISFTTREIIFFIFIAMLFAVCEALSIEFNDFFNTIVIVGYEISLNPSLMFFCISFFIIDLVTELYNDKYASYFIYAKLVSQLAFAGLGMLGVVAAGIQHGQIAHTFFVAPRILANAMIASLIGYKLTGKIMQTLKTKLKGRFLFTRYLSSTLPGEIVFSLVFTLLSFSHGRNLSATANIFIGLIIVKLVFSTFFSFLVVPITNLLRYVLQINAYHPDNESLPFTKH